jgi:hypothetical protein
MFERVKLGNEVQFQGIIIKLDRLYTILPMPGFTFVGQQIHAFTKICTKRNLLPTGRFLYRPLVSS